MLFIINNKRSQMSNKNIGCFEKERAGTLRLSRSQESQLMSFKDF